MNLHSKQWFIITAGNMTSYSSAELEMLWDTFSTSQLDFVQELCNNSYQAGYKAAEEDR